jgi:glycosyltransferase involved in cell wall biosynthesis
MPPKLSFITGVKNRSAELKEMIQSLLNQDMPEWEVIIVDDHSDEPIEKVVKQFNDHRIHYFQLPAHLTGISNARNFAIARANTDTLLTADGDDINHPERARITCEEMIKNNYDVFYSQLMDYIPEQNKKVKHLFQPFNAKLFKMFNFMTNPSTAFLRSIYQKAGGFDPAFQISEDYDLYLRMLKNGAKFGYTRQILVDYRRSPESISISKFSLMHECIMKSRIKNNIPPFDIEEVRKYALPEIAEAVLNERGKKLWQDDRFVQSGVKP